MNFGKQKVRYWILGILNLLVPKKRKTGYIFLITFKGKEHWPIERRLV